MERERALRPRATAEELSEGPISFAQKKWGKREPVSGFAAYGSPCMHSSKAAKPPRTCSKECA